MKRVKRELKEIKFKIERKRRKNFNKKNVIHFYNEEFSYNSCLCTDREENFKQLYSTQREADRRAKFIFDEYGVLLISYPCPYSSGWHLTKY